MKKLLTLLLFFCGLCFSSFGKQIEEGVAKTVGKNFLVQQSNSSLFNTSVNLQRVYVAKSQSVPIFYVFNVNTTLGFVIVSADDNIIPILGFSDQGGFDPANLPPALVKLLAGYKKDIKNIIDKNLPPTASLQDQWTALINGEAPEERSASTPNLLTTLWGQEPNYNALCPLIKNSTVRTVTGCPATAMAQIMKFWNYPTKGTSFFSYRTNSYGELSANFGTTTYNWSNMPNSISGPNADIALLMYQCGVSVRTSYGPVSSAFVLQSQTENNSSCENSYKNFFGYDATSLQGLRKINYPIEANWVALLKNEIDNGRPVQYAGFGSGGGHTWVLDGYTGSLFHMNWGWKGTADGNFAITALNPTVNNTTTGAGLGQYNSGHQALIGIKPPTVPIGKKLALNSPITVASTSLNVTENVSVTVDLKNIDANDFDGDYCAAIFDANDGTFLTIIDSFSTSGVPLASGGDYSGSGGITFSGNGVIAENGNYDIQIYYRATGEEIWELVADDYYPNDEAVTLNTLPNDLKLYSALSVNPQTLVQGQSADVYADILNNLSYDFLGEYQACLYDLDGNFIETIGSYTESSGLTSYSYYGYPLTFSSFAINAQPGTYTLAIIGKEDTSSVWYFCGSDYYTNPITIQVVTPDAPEDSYEPNDNASSAAGLTLNYTSDSASVETPGANIPEGSSYDFYQVDLAAGYDYSVSVVLNDDYYSEDGQVYTLDAIVSYATDTTWWSDAYDDVVPPVIVNGGVTFYCIVSPYFFGETGTYNLQIDVTRLIPTGIENNSLTDNIKIYPNPANDYLSIDLNKFEGTVNEVQIVDMVGREILHLNNPSDNTIRISTNDFSSGLYMMKIATDQGVVTKKFTVKK